MKKSGKKKRQENKKTNGKSTLINRFDIRTKYFKKYLCKEGCKYL